MKIKILIVIAAFIFAAGVAGSVFALIPAEGERVNIIQDGKIIRSFDLSREDDKIFTVEYNGSSNTIEIKDGKIRVKSAECPDKTCVHSGWLGSSAAPIVCLPNRLVIEFEKGAGEIDALTE